MIRIAGLALVMLLSSMFHPLRLSVTMMDIDPETGEVELSIKLFSDDFEDLIFKKYGVQLYITSLSDPGDKIEVVNRYIAEALHCSINGDAPASLEFIESRLNTEAIWLTYSYKHQGRIQKMKVINTLMLELFKNQSNILTVSYNDRKYNYRLNYKNTELSFKIK